MNICLDFHLNLHLSISLSSLAKRSLYLSIYLSRLISLYLSFDFIISCLSIYIYISIVTRKVYFYPRTGFYFARVKTGQVGT